MATLGVLLDGRIYQPFFAHRAIEKALGGAPQMFPDPAIRKKAENLILEAQRTLATIRHLVQVTLSELYVALFL
jgi:hypothetical protein